MGHDRLQSARQHCASRSTTRRRCHQSGGGAPPWSVVIRMRLVDVRRVSQTYGVFVRTEDGGSFRARLDADRRNPAGQSSLDVLSASGGADCTGLTHDLDYDTDRVLMQMRRRCLDRPRWVRISMENYRWRSDDARSQQSRTIRTTDGATSVRLGVSTGGRSQGGDLSGRSSMRTVGRCLAVRTGKQNWTGAATAALVRALADSTRDPGR